MIPFARVDPSFAKEQLELFLREWFMAPNGQVSVLNIYNSQGVNAKFLGLPAVSVTCSHTFGRYGVYLAPTSYLSMLSFRCQEVISILLKMFLVLTYI